MPEEKGIYLVNPAGAIHLVTREHARERLRLVGWRVAKPHEIAELQKREAAVVKAKKAGERSHATQTFDAPIAAPWSPEPPEEPELPDEQPKAQSKKSDKADEQPKE